MKQFLLTIILTFSAILTLDAQETYFQYPQAPDNLTTLQDRTSYLVEHFWDRCDFKTAFSSHKKFKQAFNDYISFMPYADTETINSSINALIKAVKKSPKDMLTLGQIAEESLYGDSANMWSDEIYLPFAKAVVETKKISATDKARFRHHVNILSNSQVGMTAPSIKTYGRTGETVIIDTISTPITILFFNDPECDDCRLAKARLAANIAINNLIENGALTVISIYDGEVSDEWFKDVANYPQNWVVVAAPDADSVFDMRITPSIYILNNERRIIAKNITIDNVISTLSSYK